jgi:hypothetical protein
MQLLMYLGVGVWPIGFFVYVYLLVPACYPALGNLGGESVLWDSDFISSSSSMWKDAPRRHVAEIVVFYGYPT